MNRIKNDLENNLEHNRKRNIFQVTIPATQSPKSMTGTTLLAGIPSIAPIFAILLSFSGGGAALAQTNSVCSVPCASWMHELKSEIGDTPLNLLAIPGTHDSGTYSLDPNSAPSIDSFLYPVQKTIDSVLPSQLGQLGLPSSFTNYLIGLVDSSLKKVANPIIYPWAVAQNPSHTFTVQLEAGIRYFDIRPCKDPTGVFRACHSLYGAPISNLLAQVRQFSVQHPDEIIILDFNHLEKNGITGLDSYRLGGEIFSLLTHYSPSDMLVSSSLSPTATLNQIWNHSSTARIVVLYEDPLEVKNVSGGLLWLGQDAPGTTIHTPWPAQDTAAGQLAKEIEILNCRCDPGASPRTSFSDTLFVLQTNPTPDLPVFGGALINAVKADLSKVGFFGVSACSLICPALDRIRDSQGWQENPPQDLRALADQANGNNDLGVFNYPLVVNTLMHPPAGLAFPARELVNIVQADWFDEQTKAGSIGRSPSEFVEFMIRLNVPPQTNLFVGAPQYAAANKQVFVTSQTPFTLTATDRFWTVNQIRYTYGHYGNFIPGTSGRFTVGNASVPQADGNYTVTGSATDNVDLTSSPNSLTVTLDNTPPALTVATLANGATYARIIGNTPVVYGVSDGSGSGVKSIVGALLDGKPAPASGQPLLPGIAPGPHTFTYGPATDNLGNVASAVTIAFTIIEN